MSPLSCLGLLDTWTQGWGTLVSLSLTSTIKSILNRPFPTFKGRIEARITWDDGAVGCYSDYALPAIAMALMQLLIFNSMLIMSVVCAVSSGILQVKGGNDRAEFGDYCVSARNTLLIPSSYCICKIYFFLSTMLMPNYC